MRSFLRAKVLLRSQNNRECACGKVRRWGTWVHVGGSLYVFLCMCLFVTYTMQQDHTVLLVCGISRLKIGPGEGRGQEQEKKSGNSK